MPAGTRSVVGCRQSGSGRLHRSCRASSPGEHPRISHEGTRSNGRTRMHYAAPRARSKNAIEINPIRPEPPSRPRGDLDERGALVPEWRLRGDGSMRACTRWRAGTGPGRARATCCWNLPGLACAQGARHCWPWRPRWGSAFEAAGDVSAEGDLDFRGTLGVDRTTPVGFKSIRLRFDVQSDAEDAQLAHLLRLTERYCVIYQTLKKIRPELEATIETTRSR